MVLSYRLGFCNRAVLHQLLALPAVLVFGHPDHRLPSGVALLQLLEGLGDLSEGELGFHHWQDLWTQTCRTYKYNVETIGNSWLTIVD